jgi:hypothetical protein
LFSAPPSFLKEETDSFRLGVDVGLVGVGVGVACGQKAAPADRRIRSNTPQQQKRISVERSRALLLFTTAIVTIALRTRTPSSARKQTQPPLSRSTRKRGPLPSPFGSIPSGSMGRSSSLLIARARR